MVGEGYRIASAGCDAPRREPPARVAAGVPHGQRDPDLYQLAARAGAACSASAAPPRDGRVVHGGWIAKALTDVPGSSQWFECGYVTYSDAAKMRDLGVAARTLAEFGAVSEETAREMADGALRITSVSVALAVTGIAGPDGGTPAKPVGTVWLCAGASGARGTGIIAERQHFPGDRAAVRRHSVAMRCGSPAPRSVGAPGSPARPHLPLRTARLEPWPTRRLFFALWPDEEQRAARYHATAAIVRGCVAGAPSRRKNLHLTLAFLGACPERRARGARAPGAHLRRRLLGRAVTAHAAPHPLAHWARPQQILPCARAKRCPPLRAAFGRRDSHGCSPPDRRAGFSPDLKPFRRM